MAVESAYKFAPVEEAFWLPQPARDAYYADTSKHAPYSGGIRYHGRGFIQTTHDFNYAKIGYLADPERLLEPGPAAVALASYWQERDIQSMADVGDWKQVRQAVVGYVANPPGYEAVRNAALVLLN